MDIPVEDIPEGWTNDPTLLEFYFATTSREVYLAQCSGLTDITPLLMSTQDSGDMSYIINAGNSYYWGNFMVDHIYQITKPKTLPAILRTLAESGQGALGTKKITPVMEVEEEVVEGDEDDEGPPLFVPYEPEFESK